MKIGADTSFVLRLLTGLPEALASSALRIVREVQMSGGEVLLSDLVLAEAYHALHYHYGVPKKEALSSLRELAAAPGFSSIGTASSVLATPGLDSANPGFVDRLILEDYLSRGAEQVVTFEKSARKTSHVRVVK